MFAAKRDGIFIEVERRRSRSESLHATVWACALSVCVDYCWASLLGIELKIKCILHCYQVSKSKCASTVDACARRRG